MHNSSGSRPTDSLAELSLEHISMCLKAITNLAELLQLSGSNPSPSLVENIRRSARNLTLVNQQFEALRPEERSSESGNFVPSSLIEFDLQAWQTYAVTQGIFLSWRFSQLPELARGDSLPIRQLLLRVLSELFDSEVRGTVEFVFRGQAAESGFSLQCEGPAEVLGACAKLAEKLGGGWTGDALAIPLPALPSKGTSTATSPSNTEPSLPPAIALEHLSEISGGDHDFERELLTTFVLDIEERVPILQSAVKPFDGEKLRTTAHSIAGSASCIGAQVFREKALALEYCGRDGIAAEAPNHLQAFEVELARVKEFLDLYFAD